MSKLFPIIRRVRRPLVPVEAPAEAKPAVLAAKAKPEPDGSVRSEQRKDDNGKATSNESSK